MVTAARLRAALLAPAAAVGGDPGGGLLRDLGDYDRAFGITADDLTATGLNGLDGKVA